MTDVLIRNVNPDDVLRIEARATRLGLSRQEFLRRELARLGHDPSGPTTMDDLSRFAERFADLEDEAVMRQAWS